MDLILCDFWVSPKVKMTMKAKRFESIHSIEAARMGHLRASGRRTPEWGRQWQWLRWVFRVSGDFEWGSGRASSMAALVFIDTS